VQAHISLSWLLYGRLCIQFHVPLKEYIITKSSVPLFPLLMSCTDVTNLWCMMFDWWGIYVAIDFVKSTHIMCSHRSMKLNTSGVFSHRHIETDVHYMMPHIMEVVAIVDQHSKCFVGWGICCRCVWTATVYIKFSTFFVSSIIERWDSHTNLLVQWLLHLALPYLFCPPLKQPCGPVPEFLQTLITHYTFAIQHDVNWH